MKWSLLVILTIGSLMKVKNSRVLYQCYLRALLQWSILTSAERKFDFLYFSFPYRLFHIWPFGQTLISGLQRLQTNTTFKYKTIELKRKLGFGRKERRREESQLTSSYFLKNIPVGTVFLVFVRLCLGPGLYRCLRSWSFDSSRVCAGILISSRHVEIPTVSYILGLLGVVFGMSHDT